MTKEDVEVDLKIILNLYEILLELVPIFVVTGAVENSMLN
jgi:hypothetical protein